ncbi:MAG: hypothetical protein COV72_02165 [Candidatus Omnitrophica bacterium CG11_big_fil_rev_8_21_14_0_20_42_13]|uniref:Glycosyltransferase RgtA/B/C/D-like domain-containing protein n=1 Tax=Candidatus Ghiorseimicrobium undicola TaxID=1974746 RepID=A0A2H0LZ26_9BACT|nr:MAG: hypothetical protein COV72_02165 [Candidatus Omnitrophica bacterium CG11_big_fil_rev_8_21_14_0_20_42_13]
MKIKYFLAIIILVNLFLSIYGNSWGLPSRWHIDEKIINVLHMAQEKTLVDVGDSFYHPTAYQLVLAVFLAPYFLFLKLTGCPLAQIETLASVSWIEMAKSFPDFAASIFIYARSISAIFGALTVLIIFLTARKLYDKKIALFSAASLAVCMGFIETNHIAKQLSFFNFLIVLVLFLCVCALVPDARRRRNMNLAFLFSGLAVSTQFNALLIFIPLFLMLWFNLSRNALSNPAENIIICRIKILFLSVLFFILGLLLGTPSLVTNFKDYLRVFFRLLEFGLANDASGMRLMPAIYSLFVGPANYFFEILSIYGIFLFSFILFGIVLVIKRWNKLKREEIVVFSFLTVYFFVMTVLLKDKYPQTKHIIAIVPLLSIFSGIALNYLYEKIKIPHYLKHLIVAVVFAYSFFYALEADKVFIRKDTRYASTEWIKKNIPKGAKIELFNQLAYIGSDEIFSEYNILYLGKDSLHDSGHNFFRWDQAPDKEKHLAYLNKNTSRAEYIIVSYDDYEEFTSPNYRAHIPGLSIFIKDLFSGKKGFRLVKTIQPKNKKIRLSKFPGIVINENLFWDPVPLYGSTAMTIQIFKKADDL